MNNVAAQIAKRDFSSKTLSALRSNGIDIAGTQALPGHGDMPWANAERGYLLNDGRMLTFSQVLELAK
jgi:hypothetical protein